MPAYPSFVGGSYLSQGMAALNERTINFYVERIERDGPTSAPLALYPTPGVTLLDTATVSPGRAHGVADGREFAVIGNTFYEISAAGLLTSKGTVAIDEYPATISWNGHGGGQVFVCSGNNGYLYDLDAGTFTQVRTGGTRMGDHLDGFFLALDADTATLWISDALDGTTWDGTQFLQRSTQADPWVSMRVWDRYIWMFGTETSDVLYNAGTSFPFAPHPSGLVAHGIAAPFSPQVVASGVMWASATRNGWGDVVRASGFTPEVVSTFPIHAHIDDGHHVSTGIGDTYEDRGHVFYLLTMPQHETSFAYDATPQAQMPTALRWTERATWIAEENRRVAWRPLYHAFVFGEHRMLDRETGAVYRLDASVYTDVDDRPIQRLRRPPALPARERRLFVPPLDLHVEPGLGLVTGQGSDPRVLMRASRDGGHTFGHERSRSSGAIGQYGTTVTWQRNGSVPRGLAWQPEFIFTDPIPWRVTGATLRAA